MIKQFCRIMMLWTLFVFGLCVIIGVTDMYSTYQKQYETHYESEVIK